ncbi:MAG: glycosyltransferase family 4 protein [Nocardioides sp.]|nr:glycosyltransferase family 4 protein [Nocardioides sp.]
MTRTSDTAAPGAARRVVLHVAQSVETGVAHVLDDHLRHQAGHGWQTVVACPQGSLAGIAARAGAEVMSWNATREPSPVVFREMRDLARIIRHVDPTLLHLHSAKAGLVGRLVVRGSRPTVFTPHAWSWLAAQGTTRTLARHWERVGARWADAVVCLSPAELGGATEARVPTTSTLLIPNDVDVHALRAVAPGSRSSARDRLGLPPEAPIAVCCARLVPQKGQDLLLAAWARTREMVPDARLIQVGDGPDRPALEKAAARTSGIHFAGAQPRSEAIAWMKAATVVVCPSRYEGMSLVPLEAATLGTPVVATRVQGMDGDLPAPARRLVPPNDTVALATALGDALADPHGGNLAGRQAARWAEDQMGENRSVARTLALYDEVMFARHGTPIMHRPSESPVHPSVTVSARSGS